MTTGGDPVRQGLAISLARPGGNVTGTASITGELFPKLLELVREMIPSYTGNMPDAGPTVQHLNAEPDKPLAPAPDGRASFGTAAE